MSVVSATTQAIVKKPSLISRGVKRVVDYFKQVSEDYQIVFTESIEDIPKYPVRSMAFMTTVGAMIAAASTNPTEKQMLDRLTEWRLELGTVPNSIHSTSSDFTLKDRTEMINQNRYDYLNCLLFSLIVRRTYDRKAELYETQDRNLQDWPWSQILKNVVDIGAFNKFWMLEKAFVDYDIKKEEFPKEV
ncbi:hypothetical protein FO519_009077 [Halicephalobus sp. NKZ332]|nr:hypothetical protein FO519_009077 [Halicephalobus sp. NKZ332]